MRSDRQRSFQLGPWAVEPLRGAVTGPGGEVRHVEPKVMEVLVRLAERPNEVVTREQLLDAVWPRHVAADHLLTRAVSELRRTLEDQSGAPRFIETVPKRGYRLIAADVGARRPRDPAAAAAATVRRYRALVATLGIALGLAYAVYRSPTAAPPPSGSDRVERTFGVFNESRMSIAVLPFVNAGGDAGNEYLSDGLSEEIRNLLASVPELKVIGRASSSRFGRAAHEPRAIGEALGVDALLQASVRRSGDRLRVAAELVTAADGSLIWSESYEPSIADVFDLQEDIAAEVIDALQARLPAYPRRGRPTHSPDAYAMFLKAKAALNIQDGASAESLLRSAVDVDPAFAEAWELLAHAYWTDTPTMDSRQRRQLMHDAAARALAIDPDLDFARALLLEATTDGFSIASVLEAQLATARAQPNDPAVLRTLSWTLLITGYAEEASRVAERFVALDPLSAVAHIRQAAALATIGHHGEARAAFATADRLIPGGLAWFDGEYALANGDDAGAIRHLEQGARQHGWADTSWVSELVAGGRDARSGQAFLDRRVPEIARSMPDPTGVVDLHALNRLYLLLGHLDRYLEIVLEQAAADPRSNEVEYYLWWGTVYRRLGFTAHPRYLELAGRMGYIELWEHRGPPDFCDKTAGAWRCR